MNAFGLPAKPDLGYEYKPPHPREREQVMPKVYLDTNIFLDFYQSAREPVKVFDELLPFAPHLVTTEQTVNEFRRNRIATLDWLVREFEKKAQLKPYHTAIIGHMNEFKPFDDARKAFDQAAGAIVGRLRGLIADPASDPVAVKAEQLLGPPDVQLLPLTDDAVHKAHRRKLLGQPPRSEGKETIGDEVIWELLLAGLNNDLVIVSRDGTFTQNSSMLADEYRRKTGKKLAVVESVGEAIAVLGQEPPPELVEAEDRIARHVAALRQTVGRCPNCKARAFQAVQVIPVSHTPDEKPGRMMFTITRQCANCGLQIEGSMRVYERSNPTGTSE